MAIDRLRLYLAVKEALTWRHEHDRQAQDMLGGATPTEADREALVWAELQTALDGCEHPPPIDMVLHCPQCHQQHIDEPERETSVCGDGRESQWTNPPHRSHMCKGCGLIWRPADVPTNGVQAVRTRGGRDS